MQQESGRGARMHRPLAPLQLLLWAPTSVAWAHSQERWQVQGVGFINWRPHAASRPCVAYICKPPVLLSKGIEAAPQLANRNLNLNCPHTHPWRRSLLTWQTTAPASRSALHATAPGGVCVDISKRRQRCLVHTHIRTHTCTRLHTAAWSTHVLFGVS